MLSLLRSIILFPLTGGPTPIDWNARLEASLRPDPQYLNRRQAARKGWQTRKRRG